MKYGRKESRLRLLPLVLPIGILFLSGATVTILQSFGLLGAGDGTAKCCEAWVRVLSNPVLLKNIGHSVLVATSSALISTALGTLLAWGLHKLPPGLGTLATVYKIPLILPHITIAYLVILIFGQSGVLSALAAKLGWIENLDDFPNLLYGGTGVGLVLAYVIKETPFSALMVLGQLRKLDPMLPRTARMLGASRLRVLMTVVLPHVRPAMTTSLMVLGLYTLGAFEIPWLIGASRPEMIGVSAYVLYFHQDFTRRAEAAALLTLVLIFSLVLLWPWVALTVRKQRGE